MANEFSIIFFLNPYFIAYTQIKNRFHKETAFRLPANKNL